MNERIRELALQAEKLKRDEVSHRERLHNRYCTGDTEEEIFREKFAKLIVRECAQFVEDRFDFIGDEIIVKEKMLEHFGVEE